jgi:hypothetical protein
MQSKSGCRDIYALYYTAPHRKPWKEREGIVKGWLGIKDEPGTWTFEYDVLAVENEAGIVRGLTQYKEEPPKVYSNIWLIRINEMGECTEFTEWWMEKD